MHKKRFGLRASLSGVLLVFSLSVANCLETKAAKDQDKPGRPPGTSRLWQDPGDIGSKDLYWGKGSAKRVPKPPFQFVEEDISGSNTKVDVKDANGVTWGIKFAGPTNEVHSEVAANRILWALGYMAHEIYFVPSGRIEGIKPLKRTKPSSLQADGSFTEARFKKKSNGERLGYDWQWSNNPFVGSKELSGLKILMTMINNWDTKSSNNDVVQIKNTNGDIVNWYIISDLGASFGKMAVLPSNKNRWELEDFLRQKFIDRYLNDGKEIKLHYRGKSAALKTVPTEHARWFAGFAGQLSEQQLRKVFEAAGATPEEISGFSSKLMEKIRELQTYAGQQPPIVSQPIPGKELDVKIKMTKRP